MKGSIHKRGNSWTVMVDLPRDPATGKRRQRRITAATKPEAEAQAAQLVASIADGAITGQDAGRMTVAEYLAKWLEVNTQAVRPSTQRRYRDLIRLHAVPYIGRVKLAKLSALDLQRLYANRLAAGGPHGRSLSPTTVHQLHNILHKALKQAMRWALITRNPADAVSAPRPARPQMSVWSQAEAQAFLGAAEFDDLAPLWRLALLTGMRRGELLGLTWEALDLGRGVLAVTKTIIRAPDGGKTAYSTPKTRAGKRSIALPASVIQALQRHRVRQLEHRLSLGMAWQENDLVFPNEAGQPLHPNSLQLRFTKLIQRAGVPRIRLHDLRHTAATLMLSNGTHPKIAQEVLGHSDISMTLNRYSHVTMTMQQEAARTMDALMGGGR